MSKNKPYHVCPRCGNHLDPGEHCDCEDIKNEPRHVKCKDCGKEWNVSAMLEIPWYGYRCPTCTEKYRRRTAGQARR